jgi:glycosyltransferase involved in cell wall biosynthesis
MSRKRVLCFASYFLPGFRAGGPIRSLQRAIAALSEEFEFGVVTRDRDLGSDEPYSGIPSGQWSTVEGIRVWYLRTPYYSPAALRRVMHAFRPDLLYFHSFWDPCVVAMPLLLRRLGLADPHVPALVAPRGEFAPGALALHGLRKSGWKGLVRSLGLYSEVTWHASNEREADQIRAEWGAGARVLIASDLPPRMAAQFAPARQPKVAGVLRIVFLSRLSPMKNLDGALGILAKVRTPVSLDIYGTRESTEYWQVCEQRIRQLPAHVTVSCHGPVAPDRVIATLSAYDLFFLPTLGENFGHVILEAMLSGCPVLISDRTPWTQLQHHRAGYALNLDNPEALVAVIEEFSAMSDAVFREWSDGAARFGRAYCEDGRTLLEARAVIKSAMLRT